LTIKNLENGYTIKLDGDEKAISAFGKCQNKIVSLLWNKPTSRFVVQQGQGVLYEVTLKSLEDQPSTYQKKTHVEKEDIMNVFREYGIEPKWTKFDPELKIYQKVVV
jgi:hypothetical protein